MSKITESKSLRIVSPVAAMGSAAAILGILFLICSPVAYAEAIPKGWDAGNMKPVGTLRSWERIQIKSWSRFLRFSVRPFDVEPFESCSRILTLGG